MARINVKVIGDQAVRFRLDGIGARAREMTKPMKEARLIMLGSINKNFQAAGRPTPWRPLSRSTLESKLGAGYGPAPLVRTGQLKRSITGAMQGNALVIGTSVKYARIHQRGGTVRIPEIRPRFKQALHWTSRGKHVFAKKVRAHSVHIPARPFLVFQDEDIRHISRAVADHVLER